MADRKSPRKPAAKAAGTPAAKTTRASSQRTRKATPAKVRAVPDPSEKTDPSQGTASSDRSDSEPASAPRRRPPRHAIRAQAEAQPPLRLAPEPATPPADGSESTHLPVDPAALVGALVSALRAAGSAAGLQGDELEERVAQTLAFLRRRLTGDYEIDDFGFDPDFTEEVWLPLLRPLYRHWFRVEVRGIEHIPSHGGALVVANHSGSLPIDGLMTQVAIHDEHPHHRYVRSLGADLVFQSPVVGQMARKSGVTLAANPDAERLLGSGEVSLVFPEGFKGIGKSFSERYRLQRFGRGGFVTSALRTGVPIVPCSIVGAEEIYPMIGNAKGLARMLGFPYFPITPTFPLLGPLGMIPLPSKWIIEFGEPVETASYGAASAEDPTVVLELADQVRESIQQSLHTLLRQRRSVFF